MLDTADEIVRVSVITGRDADNLRQCLQSLKETTRDTELRVSVVDNCAAFDAPALARAVFPDAEVIRNEHPKGFGANHNQVLASAREPLVMVINDDILFGDAAVDKMVEFMRGRDDVAAVGPAIRARTWDAPPVRCGPQGVLALRVPYPFKLMAADTIKELGLLRWFGGRAVSECSTLVGPIEVDCVVGVCCLARTPVLREVGLFDEGFHMYYEDLDLGVRLRRSGYRMFQAPGAEVVHRISTSKSPHAHRTIYQSGMYFARKHYGRRGALLTMLSVCVLKTVRGVKRVLGL